MIEKILSDLIKIKSVNPPGGEMEVAKYLQELFDREDIENEIIESDKDRGNFLAYLGDGKKRLLLLSHTDVVPAEERSWDFDPFSGEIGDGFVYGRGALDCKDLVAAEANAMIQLKRKGIKLEGKLIFAATADEEKGGEIGVGYLVKNHLNKIKADFAINEGAGFPIQVNGKRIYLVQTGEKGIAWSKLKTKGKSVHGSMPSLGENAVVKMAEAVSKISKYQPEIVLIPEVKTLIESLAKLKGFSVEVNPENVDLILSQFPKEKKVFTESLRAVTRMTLSPNIIKGGLKTNIVPDFCEAEVDIRVLPSQSEEFVKNELEKILGDDVEIEIPAYHKASNSPAGTSFYKLIEKTIRELVPDVLCLPFYLTGATDSKFLRSKGIPSYGFSPASKDFDLNLIETIHGKNERIDIESLKLKTQFLERIAERYLS
ncbi:MAG: ArgE/DapE family deacylase [Candidatus Methanofastidiosia archaeon]